MNQDNTLFLRFIAIILVINSHMDALYPIPLFATGGAIGNSLFFMLSAFGLLLSERTKPQTLSHYFSKRIIRIYPVVWSSVFLLALPVAVIYYLTSNIAYYQSVIDEFGLNNPLEVISMLFFPPSPYWFLQALMFYYLIGFFFLKNYTTKKIIIALSFLAVIYILAYLVLSDFSILFIEQIMAFKLIFYAMVFLTGLYFASINDKITYRGVSDFFLLFGIIIIIYTHKYLMLNGILSQLQFIQQLLLFPALYYFMKISKSPLILNVLMQQRFLSGPITLIGAMTLELYLVHGLIRPLIVQYIPGFPENVAIYLLFVFVLAYLLYRINNALIDRIKEIK